MLVIRVGILCLLPALAAAQPVQLVEVLHEFDAAPSRPDGALLQVPDGSFYGVTSDAIYRVAVDGTVTIAARLRGTVGASGALVRGPDGTLYGATQWGGTSGQGTVFRFDPATGAVRIVHTFTGLREGISPHGNLAVVGGLLYGVTNTTIFRLDPATGATTILYTFGEHTPGPIGPTSGLTLAADGRLYGTARAGPDLLGSNRGAIYRIDPATGAFAVAHAFADLAEPDGRLLLGPDNRLYGSARSQGPMGGGGVFRFDPATNGLAVLYAFAPNPPFKPGPVEMTPDGSLYGVTVGSTDVVPTQVSTLFRLRATGGSYVYEALLSFDLRMTGLSSRAQLTRGADGLLYGYAQEGGSVNAGTLFRFDPAGGGAPTNPIAFTVLHAFAPTPGTFWAPSEPSVSTSALLVGTTSRPGRGAIYALDPVTGAVTLPATIPEAQKFLLPESQAVNSPLAIGPSGFLYGTTSVTPDSGAPGGGNDSAVIRYLPGDIVMRRANAQTPLSTTTFTDSPLVAPAGPDPFGDMYFVRDRTVYRFHNNSDTVVAVGSAPDPGPFGSSSATRLVRATDGSLYVGISTTVRVASAPFGFMTTARVFRVNQIAGTLDLVIDLGGFAMSSLAAAPGGRLYLGASTGVVTGGSEFHVLDPASGQAASVCYATVPGLTQMTAMSDGTIVGIAEDGPAQRLLVCHPSTRGVDVRMLPASIGHLSGALVEINGALYGATLDPPIARFPGLSSPAPRHPGGALIRLSPSGAPGTLDTEADGLPNQWETTYGLDPFSADGDQGAGGDPDGDGRTNAQELADGTHPRGVLTRYFAEGATGPFFRTRFDVANPNFGRAANVLLRFLTDGGQRVTHNVLVPAAGHVAVDAAAIPGLAYATFSTVLEADQTVAVDRTMTWDASGYGSDLETGVVAPSTTWYLAEGSTSGAFSLFYLLQNPQQTAVTATLRYLRPFGQAPIDRTITLPPNSRTTVAVDEQGPELASTDVSAVITASAPIVAERAMYYSQPGQPFAAGHESAGVTAPSLEWFLAEGATGAFFDLFVLIANPNPAAATVDVEYLLAGGGSLTKTYTVAANSRHTIWVDDEELPAGSGTKPFASTSLSMAVRSTNAVPIVVERTMWWPGPAVAANFWYEAHNSPGATAAATRWVVPAVEGGGDAQAQTWVLIANPTDREAQVSSITLTNGGSLSSSGGTFTLPPKSRTSFPFTGGSGTLSSQLIESVGTVPVPIIVEHANYSSPGGVLWAAGAAALAAPLP